MNQEYIKISLPFIIDDNGNKIYDIDLIREEFEDLLAELES